MVSITLSVPQNIRIRMKEYEYVNWSAFIRYSINKKIKDLDREKRMIEDEKSLPSLLGLVGLLSEDEAKKLEKSVSDFRNRFKNNLEQRTPS